MEDRCKEKILSEDYWDFIVSPYREGELEGVDREKMCIQELDFGYKSVSLDSRMLLPLSLRQYWYGAIPKCYTLLDMQPLDAAGIITLQNYPTLQLMGEGIMIGFLDTGIDYTHPVFRNLDGTTRIAGIWDQTIQDGDPPEGFLYGTEYTEERINAALHSESPQELISSEDTDGHGTFVASVAAGSAESALLKRPQPTGRSTGRSNAQASGVKTTTIFCSVLNLRNTIIIKRIRTSMNPATSIPRA